MDQTAFRALVGTPRASTSERPATAMRGWGLTQKRGPPKPTKAETDEVPQASFKPRKQGGKPKKGRDGPATEEDGGKGKAKADDTYRDRAKERRGGKGGDFADAEKLLETFQARAAAAGSDLPKELLDKQMAYLGGDAEHTVLVKGLDMALLERRRAELANGGGVGGGAGLAQVTDDDLEAALQGGEADEPAGVEPLPAIKASKKRTRDEMVAELKAKRGATTGTLTDQTTDGPSQPPDELKATGKFRPINARGKTEAEKEEEERRERKRRRKEKRRDKAEREARALEEAQEAAARQQAAAAAAVELAKAEAPVPPAASETPSEPAPVLAPAVPTSAEPPAIELPPPPIVEEEDDDVDIFGDAGDYKGLGDSSDEDDDAAVAEEPGEVAGPDPVDLKARALADGRRTWFDDEPVEGSAEPAAETVAAAAELVNALRPTADRPTSASPDAAEDEDDAEAGPSSSRLVGLSGSSDVSALLAMDKQAERAEKKAAKKLKGKAAREAKGSQMTDSQKLNRDWQTYQNFERQKDKDGDAS